MKSIAVYCSSSNKINDEYKDEARKIGSLLAQKKIKIIYGGGNMGLMGILSNSALDSGGDVYGVITNHLLDIEKRNESLNNYKIVDSMHDRKMEMYNNADAFLILPGGIGTLEEFFEVYSWKQLHLHNKPIFIYNYKNFWDDLIHLVENLIKKNFADENMIEAYKIINNHNDLEKILEINGKD
jgi:hypothetical protein|tara:strand:+ start:142 stop:690 length:549 start_codon:yes stop_codon:yes gene_type:complete